MDYLRCSSSPRLRFFALLRSSLAIKAFARSTSAGFIPLAPPFKYCIRSSLFLRFTSRCIFLLTLDLLVVVASLRGFCRFGSTSSSVLTTKVVCFDAVSELELLSGLSITSFRISDFSLRCSFFRFLRSSRAIRILARSISSGSISSACSRYRFRNT